MLMGSQPGLLTRVTMDVWRMLRNELSLNNIKSVVTFLLNSPLANVVSFMCLSNPDSLLPIVMTRSELQFLKEFVRKWPKNKHIDASLIGNRILESLAADSYNDISTGLEIAELLLKRMTRPPFRHEIEIWRNIFISVESRWESATISHRAAMIDLFCSATRFGIVSMQDLSRFLVYDSEFPTVYQASIIHVSTVFLLDEKIPSGLLDYYEKLAIDRDPTLFIAVLESLRKTFNFLYRMRPNKSRRILELCVDPLPQYYVEQIHLIRLIRKIDSEGRQFLNLSNIVAGLLVEPNPMVLDELTGFIRELDIEVPYSNLDWFENASSYLSVLRKVSPSFVVELLDEEIIPLTAFPSAAKSIMENKDLSEIITHLLPKAISLVFAGIKELSFDLSSEAKSLMTFGEKCTDETKELLRQMIQITDQNLPDTSFGKIMEACLHIIAFSMPELTLSLANLIGLIDICCLLGVSFTEPCSKIITKVLETRNNQQIRKRINQFFALPLHFDSAENVSFAAVSSLPEPDLLSLIDYIDTAAETNRDYLLILYLITDDISSMRVHRTFLALRPFCMEYVNRCAEELPFSEWELREGDDDAYFELLEKKIELTEDLDDTHAIWVGKFPDAFSTTSAQNEVVSREDLQFSLGMATFLQSDVGSSSIELDDAADEVISETNESVPYDPYHFKQLSNTELLCFLWFSSRHCEGWDEIQRYVMRHFVDVRLVAAFFAYAHRRKMPVDVLAWASKIRIDRNNRFSLVAASLYFKMVKCKWNELTETQKCLINRVLLEFGIEDDTEFSLMKSYYSTSGLRKMVISSIIEIDTSRFDESPIITALFDAELNLEDRLDELLEILKSGPNEMVYNIMANRWFPGLEVSEFEHITYPEMIEYCHQFMKVKIGISKLERITIPEEQIDTLLDFMESFGTSNNFLCHVLSNVVLTERQNLRLMRLLWPGNPLYCQALAVRVNKKSKLAAEFPQFVNDHQYLLQEFPENSPPSYSRQLLKVLLDPSHSIKKSIGSIKPVFYELLFDGYELIDHRFVDGRFPCPVDYDQFQTREMRHLFASSHSRLHVIVETLFGFDNDRLCRLFHVMSPDLAVLELASTFVACLRTERRYVFDTIYVTKAIMKRASLEPLMSIFMSDDFLNNGDIKDVYIILKLYLRHLRATDLSEELVQMMIENKIQDSSRRDLIQNENVTEGLSQILCE